MRLFFFGKPMLYIDGNVLMTIVSDGLNVSIASVSIAGIKSVNEDAVDSRIPDEEHIKVSKGVVFAIADGVSSAEAGKEASCFATTQFIEEYLRTPDTWSVEHAGGQIMSSINLSLFKKSHEFAVQEKGYLCTFIGVVIKSRTAHFFHAGDSRLFLLRKGEIKQITRDHCVNIGGGKNILARAVGMDNNLQLDYGRIELQEQDILITSTDGLHEFVNSDEFVSILDEKSAEKVTKDQSNNVIKDHCEKLIQRALNAKSDDNISCVIAKINHLPNESLDDYNAKLTRLPFPPDLQTGMSIDGYLIEELLFASSRSQVFRVKDSETNARFIMKTPSLNYQDDTHYIDRFIQEEWIGKRIKSKHVVQVIEQKRPRTCLYYLMEIVEGISLDKWMEKNPLPTPKQAIGLVKQIGQALKAFHDADTIHQDLKPANIMVDERMQVKVIDFGSVFVAGVAEIFVPLEHIGALGTATYSDPHYLKGRNTGIRGDIYAFATITYELFTGHLPYGEKIEDCYATADFDKLRYRSASEYNPIIPIWFDRALAKGCELNLDKRYDQLQDFLNDINHPNPQFLMDDPELDNSKGLLFWQMMSAFWIVMLIIVVILFSTSN